MQRRNSTRSLGTDHRKSTSSARSVQLVHIHPEQAEYDAQNAAIQAFSRARERSSADVPQWPPVRDNTSGPGRACGSPADHPNSSTPRRKRSVRFVRPRAPPARPESLAPLSTPAAQTGMRIRTVPECRENRPPGSASANGMMFAAKGAAGDYINALITGEEYYTPEDNIASVPSSYRRLRKSRSMFTSSETRSYQEFQPEDAASTPTQRERLNPAGRVLPRIGGESIQTGGLRAPKSMSFLRSRASNSNMSSQKYKAPVTSTFSENRQPNHPEFLFTQTAPHLRPKSNQPEKTFRKTLRDVGNGVTPTNLRVPKDGSLRNRARKVSQNLKYRLRSLFNISRDTVDSASIPPQQIQSHKTHVSGVEKTSDRMSVVYSDGLETETTTISRVTSGVPSLHAVPSEQQLRSRQGSLESVHSEGKTSDEMSRVTSWTDSDANTFGTFNSSRGEWEKQRLSVIKENGAHISSSARQHLAGSGRAIRSANMTKDVHDGSTPTTRVDGHRIYSALMKRVDQQQRPPLVPEERRQQSVEDFMADEMIPTRNSPKELTSTCGSTPVTIRHIASQESSSPHPPRVSSAQTHIPHVHHKGDPDDTSTTSSRPVNGSEVETRTHPNRGLSERSSAFFGSPACHLFRTQSPYRRAIQSSMRAAAEAASPRSPEFNPWMKALNGLHIRRPSTSGSEPDKKMTYAESIYSSDDLEPVNGACHTASIMGRLSDPPTGHGDATIFLGPPSYKPVTTINPIIRTASSASSVEWKTWLSANVSKLEQPSLSSENLGMQEGGLEFPRLLRSSGHLRESAQISNEEEIDISLPRDSQPTSSPTSPLVSSSDQASSHLPPDADMSLTSLRGKERRRPVPPPIPTKSVMRPDLTRIDSKPCKGVWGKSSEDARKTSSNPDRLRRLTHARPLNALRTQNQNITTVSTRASKPHGGPRVHAPAPATIGTVVAVDGQFNKTGGGPIDANHHLGLRTPVKGENISPHAIDDDDPYGIQGSGVLGPGSGLSTHSVGSRRMVDLFLDSRRKRIAGTEDSDVFL